MDRFNGAAPAVPCYQMEDTEIHTWFERDRQCVELRSRIEDETILEWWDDEVSQAVEDGLLNPRDWHRSAYECALHLNVITS